MKKFHNLEMVNVGIKYTGNREEQNRFVGAVVQEGEEGSHEFYAVRIKPITATRGYSQIEVRHDPKKVYKLHPNLAFYRDSEWHKLYEGEISSTWQPVDVITLNKLQRAYANRMMAGNTPNENMPLAPFAAPDTIRKTNWYDFKTSV